MRRKCREPRLEPYGCRRGGRAPRLASDQDALDIRRGKSSIRSIGNALLTFWRSPPSPGPGRVCLSYNRMVTSATARALWLSPRLRRSAAGVYRQFSRMRTATFPSEGLESRSRCLRERSHALEKLKVPRGWVHFSGCWRRPNSGGTLNFCIFTDKK